MGSSAFGRALLFPVILVTACGIQPGDESGLPTSTEDLVEGTRAVSSAPVATSLGPRPVATIEVTERDWECDLASLMAPIKVVATGSVRTIGPEKLRFDEVWGATLSTQELDFATDAILTSNSIDKLTAGKSVRAIFLNSAGYEAGSTLDYRSFDPAIALGQDEVIALFESFTMDTGTHLRLRALLTTGGDGGATFVEGKCSAQLNDDLSAISEYLRLEPVDVLATWAESDVDAETGESSLVADLERARAVRSTETAAAAWEGTDPTLRSLRPADVPPAIRSNLNVKAVRLEIVGLKDDEVVILRSPSGVSGAVFGDVLPSTEPIFFSAEDDFVEVLIGKAVDDPEARSVSRVSIADLTAGAGVRVDGPAESVGVSVLAEADAMKLLGLDSPSELEELRLSLLATS